MRMPFIKFSAWICLFLTLILFNVFETYSEPLHTPLETENKVKYPIVVSSTTVLPDINEVGKSPDNASEKELIQNDPIETVAVETVQTDHMDINHSRGEDASYYQSDVANNELSMVSKEVVEKQTSIEIQPTEANEIIEVIKVTEPPQKSTEPDNDDDKEKNYAEAGVNTTQVAPTASTSLLKCYSCSSERTLNCVEHPSDEVGCPIRQGETHNGCFALVKAHSNITTRGCIADLTDEGLGYCKNNKQCMFCYESRCNQLKFAFNGGLANLQSESMLIVFGIYIVAFINC